MIITEIRQKDTILIPLFFFLFTLVHGSCKIVLFFFFLFKVTFGSFSAGINMITLPETKAAFFWENLKTNL